MIIAKSMSVPRRSKQTTKPTKFCSLIHFDRQDIMIDMDTIDYYWYDEYNNSKIHVCSKTIEAYYQTNQTW
jgi:hypothetical protein